ncbi:MAG: NUDIX hydrolase [Pseudomonadota bacterium]
MTPYPVGLAAFTPETAQDQTNWERLCALVAHGPVAFSRDTARGGHVTASAFVLSPDRGSVLLTHHRKLDMWLQLGGHCDGIVDTPFVALKEAYEESGLTRIVPLCDDIFDIDILPVPAFGDQPVHLHYDVRYLMQASDVDVTVSDESHDLAWVALNAMEACTSEPTMLRMRDKAVAWLELAGGNSAGERAEPFE